MTAAEVQGPAFRAQRRAAIARHPSQIGLDYVEVVGPARLRLFFVPAAPEAGGKSPRPPGLDLSSIAVRAEGGREQARVRQTAVRAAEDPRALDVDLLVEAADDDALVYTLELSGVPRLDPFFTSATFALDPEQLSAIDPRGVPPGDAPPPPAPEIDYLARDYAGFRRLMFNRLSTLIPGWREPHPADLSHTLVEVLAYAADQLSYYQDAVATEAYLGTARRRISVARHARLVDYAMHEGCNARVWVRIIAQPGADVELPAGARLLTRIDGSPGPVLPPADAETAIAAGALVFETLHPLRPDAAHNELALYTWGSRDFTLPPGAVRAALAGHLPGLAAGQVLILAEVRGADDLAASADPARRHAVRLTAVEAGGRDELGADGRGVPITIVSWRPEDALPAGLTVAASGAAEPLAAAYGNIVLADHGRTVGPEELAPAAAPPDGAYRPQLRRADLTFHVPYDHARASVAPASSALAQDPRRAVAAVVRLTASAGGERGREDVWRLRRDLLDVDRYTPAFVVEMESDGRAQLRFGDGAHGRRPPPGARFQAVYRVGKGLKGNVGRGSIAHLVGDSPRYAEAVAGVDNPLPARGGVEPEPIEQVRLYAPQAFRTQQRCVVEADYAAAAERHPDVDKAAAFLRWTGSWYTAVVVVDRRGGRTVDDAFLAEMQALFAPLRPAGYEVVVRDPRFVSLDIALEVHVAPSAFASAVKQDLALAFGDSDGPAGRGFFHPDRLTIAEPVYLSQLITRAMQVPGVRRVEATRFQRLGRQGSDGLRSGKIDIGPIEKARVHNDPAAPQRGRITFITVGGR